MATELDPDGWTYARDFMSTAWVSQEQSGYYVRRRMWKRELVAPAVANSTQQAGRRQRKVLDEEA